MISIVKLTTGAEIIGEVLEENRAVIVIDNPLQVNYRQRNEALPPTISLHRFIPFAGTNMVTLKQEHIISKVSPLHSMVKYYEATLKNIQESVDPNIDQELLAASGEEDLSPESQAKLAMIEKHITKPTVN
jgi:hypothetical protein